ncbi:FecCD family ABC transporter permease [Amorphus sp. 3PC139-8]|uniref:FecCD family ABC transporter permease n=1 Tax=Amorphus sp. 3PC139-8 TaxID=2735676 RepID=UPI00345DB43E
MRTIEPGEDVAHHRDILYAHARAVRRRVGWIAALAAILVVSVVLDLMTGPAWLGAGEVVRSLLTGGSGGATADVVVWQVRLPTACLAVLVGASLSLAGTEMQTILRNPLASPFTLGVSSAAAFGAALAIVLGISLPLVPEAFAVPANAFVFAFGAVMLIQLIATVRGEDGSALILFGIAMVFTFNALVSAIQFVAPAASLQELVFWTMGGLGRADRVSVFATAAVFCLVLPFSLAAAVRLTLLELGEERARSLGVSLQRLRFGCLARASLLAATAVAFAGTIGFVGLVGPHVARLMVGDDHRLLLPASILSGAAIMSLSSIAAKLVLPGVIMPIGIVTTLVGLPFFVMLLFGRRRRG